jgi:hypothetical protein
MSAEPSRHILLIGLPSAGKTSFLAALWFMVSQPAVKCALTVDSLVGDRTYLNAIAKAWMEYKAVSRTRLNAEQLSSMTLKDQSSNLVKLTFPDLSGESFLHQWSKRELTTSYDKLMQQATGCILFINPEKVIQPLRIDTAMDIAAQLDDGPKAETSAPEQTAPTQPWNREKAPTQVQLVELLQIITSRDYFRPPLRLAVVLSAFDVLRSSGLSPKEFIARDLPLLDQYLASNKDLFEVAIYGISAQGSRYASPEILPRMITEPEGLKTRLIEGRDSISKKLWELIDPTTKLEIEREPDATNLRRLLAESLNQILAQPDLYSEDIFLGIQLRPETQNLANDFLQDVKRTADLRCFHRKLLEDVYGTEISKDWEFQQEEETLKRENPANRIFIVGDGVRDKHDITELIQWLMR